MLTQCFIAEVTSGNCLFLPPPAALVLLPAIFHNLPLCSFIAEEPLELLLAKTRSSSSESRWTTGHLVSFSEASTSSTSARPEWALLDINRKRQIAVGSTGPQPATYNHKHNNNHNHTTTATQSQSQTHNQNIPKHNHTHNHKHTNRKQNHKHNHKQTTTNTIKNTNTTTSKLQTLLKHTNTQSQTHNHKHTITNTTTQ